MSTAPFDPHSLVAQLPTLPGVYRMLGPAGEVLYVGKALDLKKRVGSYFLRSGRLSPRIHMMLQQVASIEVTTTRSEAEALLLENNLIKSLTPRYNILFRDDKSYPYLLISVHRFPRIGFHRGARGEGDRHFGPFPHAAAVREAIVLLQRVFRLRTCEDSVLEHRSRPCLLHQISRCSAPCAGLIDPEHYARDVQHAALFLDGREDDVLSAMESQMQAASTGHRYEEAAAWRDRIRALSRVQARQYVESRKGVDADVLACAVEGELACVNLVMIRGGRHIGDRSYFPHNAKGALPAEIVAAFVAQHYAAQTAPALVYAHERVPAEATAGAEIRVLTPAQGERRMWVERAYENARLALARHVHDQATQEARLLALREALALPETAQRIECFDISHTQGEATVASCVVYDRNAMQKSEYRRFNISGIRPGDDYAAMRQVLERRYRSLAEGEGKVPDLVLIDGGAGQVTAARQALAELGLSDVAIVGVAKGPERKAGLESLVVEGSGGDLSLPPQHPALHLIQSIRDEAHRFALLGHRGRRGRARTQSVIDEIPGIGPRRRQKLLARFGGVRQLQAAALDEIARVDGIGPVAAGRIYRYLHGQDEGRGA